MIFFSKSARCFHLSDSDLPFLGEIKGIKGFRDIKPLIEQMSIVPLRRVSHHDGGRILVTIDEYAKVTFHGGINGTANSIAAHLDQPVGSRFDQLLHHRLVVNRFKKTEKSDLVADEFIVQIVFDGNDSPHRFALAVTNKSFAVARARKMGCVPYPTESVPFALTEKQRRDHRDR